MSIPISADVTDTTLLWLRRLSTHTAMSQMHYEMILAISTVTFSGFHQETKGGERYCY